MVNFLFSQENNWLIQIILGVLILIGIDFVLKRTLRKYHDEKLPLNFIFLSPMKYLLWVIGVYYILQVTFTRFDITAYHSYLIASRNIAIIICFTIVVLRWIQRVIKNLASSQLAFDETSLNFMKKLLYVVVLFISGILILEMMGLNIYPLVAFGGIGAATIGFASKDMFANFFGGLVLHISRPFKIGDEVNFPSLNITGEVENIGWYFTHIRNTDKCLLFLPNSTFSSAVLINDSRRSHRKLEEKIVVVFEDRSKISSVVKKIQKLLESKKNIDTNQSLIVSCKEFVSFGIEIFIKCYLLETKEKEFLLSKQEILLEISQILKEDGVEIAYPKTQVKLDK
jgi:MscS family membrane protein